MMYKNKAILIFAVSFITMAYFASIVNNQHANAMRDYQIDQEIDLDSDQNYAYARKALEVKIMPGSVLQGTLNRILQVTTPIDCSNIIAQCANCFVNQTNQLVCNACKGDLELVSNTCRIPTVCSQVIQNCQTCEDIDNDAIIECTKCQENAIIQDDGKCIFLCQIYIAGCSNCSLNQSRQIICQSCKGDQTVVLNACEFISCGIAIPNCTSCQDMDSNFSLQCKSCQTPFIVNPNNNRECVCPGNKTFKDSNCNFRAICSEFIANCETCNENEKDGQLTCIKCFGDWQLIGNTCQSPSNCSILISNCVSCKIDENNKQLCLACDGDKIVNFINACEFPVLCSTTIQHCHTCNDNDKDNQLTCTRCLGDWQLNTKNNSCIQPTNCSKIPDCELCAINFDNDILECSSCFGKSIYNGTVCLDCNIKNCADCGLDQNILLICDACNLPYALSNSLKSCDLICSDISNCKNCSVSGTNLICDSCIGDWILQDNQCVAPDTRNCSQYFDRCATCTFIYGVLNCDTCTNGKVPVNNICAKEDECRTQNCQVCKTLSSQAYCSQCQNGYVLNTYFQKLNQRQCLKCSDNCNACRILQQNRQVRITCYSCKTGYSLINGSCQICSVKNCSQCASSKGTTCARCNILYGITRKRQCRRCPTGCLECKEILSGSMLCIRRIPF